MRRQGAEKGHLGYIPSMKAAYLNRHGGPEVLEYGDLPDLVPGPGEVVVRTRYSGLNHLDLWNRRGLPNVKYVYPFVLGADASGIVDKLGAGVSDVKEGDEVVVHPGLSCLRCPRCLSGWESLCSRYGILGETTQGTNAGQVRVPAANCFPKPAGLSFAEAAAVPLVFTTAWQMVVVRGGVKPGDLVLVHAAGSGVGSAAIQIACLHGADVIATAGEDRKLEAAKALGARYVINYRNLNFLEAVRKIARKGVDVVIDHLGRDHWENNLKATRWGGKVVVCGATSGFEATTDLRQIFYRQLQVLGSTMGSKGDFPAILTHLDAGRLKAIVGLELPLSDARRAHEALEGRGVFGKVILNMD